MIRRRVLVDGGHARGRRGLARYTKELAFQLSHAGRADVEIDMLIPAGGATELAARLGPGLRLVERPYRGFALWQAELNATARQGYEVFHGLDNGLPPGLPSRIDKVATVHDVSFLDGGLQTTLRNRVGNAWRANRFRALRHAGAAVVADSASTAAGIAAAGVRPTRVAPPPVALMLSTPPRRPAALTDQPYLLIAAGASGYKRASFAVTALAPLARSAGLRLVVFGMAADAVNATPEVQVLGALDDGEVAFLYGHARLTVFPSIREGFGLPMVESVGFGAPAVAANLPPMNELRLPGLSFFRADDAQDLRRAVTDALAASAPSVEGPRAVADFYASQPGVADLYGSL